MNVELHIDELVLHGLDPRIRWAVADALRGELTRLIAERGPGALRDAAGLDIPSLDAGNVRLHSQANGAAIGRSAADAVHAALTGPPRGSGRA